MEVEPHTDTEGGFTWERYAEIVAATVEHANGVAGGEQMSVAAVLEATYLKRPRDKDALLADVLALPVFLAEHPCVRAVVVDSVAFPFQKGAFDQAYGATREVALLVQALAQTAAASGCAVVITNHVTAKPAGRGSTRMVPSMGEGFGHVSAVRLHLLWAERVRCVSVEKTVPGLEATAAAAAGAAAGSDDEGALDIGSFALPFAVVAAGIRPTCTADGA